ncbi:MAG: RNA polymerase subunit sigma-70 [Bdellovibrio sp. CG12_big_fil_rev_8_21_14_0_65_39_13]|nr:MAG: RNA polymerase subunit sigma-70 [Bdellovibrio sp. CG22_combo_CG10-13_8_21_14_all_39_27]PIQ59523.1 MAG: RNA polymerase subunit sigma-70 [Bdellovibrio sp. CG12_big_fil_rev_8_21_14_0_65_39_13]PIR33472.1 MAG: RNA polymerase subunit sigma-70 [Bdellovibrio sp. CG11_big_fil_rev_8_21_14_0_20_39_38]PJB52255.1 MAG: RNA polymerase subunit sigma-70 [Bdellovibrio sp. CG_4_9_14_3_um_filter_39_7]
MAKKDDSKENKVKLIPEILDKDLLPQKMGETLPSTYSDDLEITAKELDRYHPSKGVDPLTTYIRQISRYKVLSADQEKKLVDSLLESGDIEAAKELVVHNLKLVVKIALEYRTAWQNVMDLIQEGNIGLMKAVSKFDPSKGAKLSYYASWWIRSYILKFILDNFRMVKMSSSNDQKKLFYNLNKEKNRLKAMGIDPTAKVIAENLGVSEKAVMLMDQRIGEQGGEVSMDAPLLSHESSSTTFGDTISNEELPIDEQLANEQGIEILTEHLKGFVAGLKDRDKEIFQKRLMAEVPQSLQSIADDYGVSRERIRQIEERLLNNLKVYMEDYLR